MGSKPYSGRDVKQVKGQDWVKGRAGQAVWVGIDVGKYELKLVVHWGAQEFERPWNVPNPLGIPRAIELLQELGAGRTLVVAMEPSGTYGDAFRQAAHDAGLLVHRVHPKVAHDYAEVFDGVPSQHDGKDAAMLGELARTGKSVAWAYGGQNEWEQEMAYWVQAMDVQRRLLAVWTGRLEALLARHWPEAGQKLKVNSPTLLKALIEHGSPTALGAAPSAAEQLRRWSRHLLSGEKIQQLLHSACGTVGVRMGPWDQRRLRDGAAAAQAARREMGVARRRLVQLALGRPAIQAMAAGVGLSTACVLWVCLGDPGQYHCGPAYVKAMGLNLTERSSGMYRGRLQISKRGHGIVRYWLWLAAIRWMKDPAVRPWYEAKKQRDGGHGGKAVVGVMRRLGLALWHVGACGEAFEAARVFPGLRRQKERQVHPF